MTTPVASVAVSSHWLGSMFNTAEFPVDGATSRVIRFDKMARRRRPVGGALSVGAPVAQAVSVAAGTQSPESSSTAPVVFKQISI